MKKGRAKERQKEWYDRHARERELKVGVNVLVLLPTSTSKLLAKWQGPHVVMARKDPVTYEVDMGERRKQCRTYHVNMLKPWNEKGETSLWLEEEEENEVEESEIVTWEKEVAVGAPTLGADLSGQQKGQLEVC